MKSVLIFGASGFVGRYLSKEFIEHGYKVIGVDKIESAYFPKEATFLLLDILDYNSVEIMICEIKPDLIINLAAISSVGASWDIPQETMMINVIGALNILEVIKNNKLNPKIMFVGSSEEYVVSNYPMSEDRQLNASNPYGISKVTQERFARLYREQYGMKIYYVRPFNHTGVGQRDCFVLPSWCKQIAAIEKSGKPGKIKIGNLEIKRDFSHVKDIVRAYRMIIESDNCELSYNVGSGKAYYLKDMLDYIIGLCHQEIEVELDVSRIRLTDQPVICCDHNLITSELGWEPEYTVFDALREMYDEYCKQE